MASRWFCRVFGREMGPLGLEDLARMARSGTLTEDDRVRREGSNDWIPARKIKGLFGAAAGGRAEAVPPVSKRDSAPPAADGGPNGVEPSSRHARRIRRRRLLCGSGIVLAVVAAIVVASVCRSKRTSGSHVPGGEAADLAAQFTQDFRERFEPQYIQLVGGARPDQHCKIERTGLRLFIPDASEVGYCAASARIVVKGDFEITVGFTILDLPKPKAGFGAGLLLSVEDSQGERAAVQRLHREKEGHVFASYRGVLGEDGSYQHHARLQPTAATSGWFRLRRVGTTIQFQVADADADHFTNIHEAEFTEDDVAKLRLAAQTGGSPTGVDVVWTYLDVRAEELEGGFQESGGPKTWRFVAVVSLTVILLGGAGAAFWIWTARRAQLRPAPPLDPPKKT
ncbi:MAG: DUF1583 domain-containing protein [Planctomycetota bacterium]